MSGDAVFETLHREHPWPERRPAESRIDWSMDAGGRDTLVRLIRDRGMTTVLEIGVFLGGSLRQWLDASPAVRVVAVDPWPCFPQMAEVVRRHGQPDSVGKQLTAHADSLYHTFLSNFWEQRQRIVPVRGMGLAVLEQLAAAGLQPDLIYLDADKSGEELLLCERLFPRALMAGDDWFWTDAGERYRGRDEEHPIRGPVRANAARRGGHLLVDQSTWVVLDTPPALPTRIWYSTRYFAKSAGRRLKRELRVWRGTRCAPNASTPAVIGEGFA